MKTDGYDLNVYAPDTKPLLRALLATLADIDFVHEQDVTKAFNTTAKNPDLKARVLQTLMRQHRERREPYVRQISALQSACRMAP